MLRKGNLPTSISVGQDVLESAYNPMVDMVCENDPNISFQRQIARVELQLNSKHTTNNNGQTSGSHQLLTTYYLRFDKS